MEQESIFCGISEIDVLEAFPRGSLVEVCGPSIYSRGCRLGVLDKALMASNFLLQEGGSGVLALDLAGNDLKATFIKKEAQMSDFNRIVVNNNVTGADGRLLVDEGAVGTIVGRDRGIVDVLFDAGPTYVALDGSGRRIQGVPFIDTMPADTPLGRYYSIPEFRSYLYAKARWEEAHATYTKAGTEENRAALIRAMDEKDHRLLIVRQTPEHRAAFGW